MFKKILSFLALATGLACAQSHTIPTTDGTNSWTGPNTYVPGNLRFSGVIAPCALGTVMIGFDQQFNPVCSTNAVTATPGWAGHVASTQNPGDTTLAMNLITGTPPSVGYFLIDSEWEEYTTVTANGGISYTLGGIQRGKWKTTAATHNPSGDVTAAISPFSAPTDAMFAYLAGGPGTNVFVINCPNATSANGTVVFQIGCIGSGAFSISKSSGTFNEFSTSLNYLSGAGGGLSISQRTQLSPFSDVVNNAYALTQSSHVVHTDLPSQMDSVIGFNGIAGISSVPAPNAAAPTIQQDFAPSGSTTYSYLCQGTDALGLNIPGAVASIPNLAASTWGTGGLNIYCPLIPGAVTTTLYRTAGGPNQGILATANTGALPVYQERLLSASAGSPNMANTTVGAVCTNTGQFCVLSGTSSTPPLACTSGREGWEYRVVSASPTTASELCQSGTWGSSFLYSFEGDRSPNPTIVGGGVITCSLTSPGITTCTAAGGGLTGTISPGSLADTVYPAGSASTTVIPAPSNYTMPPSSTTSQINALQATSGIGIRIPPNAIYQPFTNTHFNYMEDERPGVHYWPIASSGAMNTLRTFPGSLSGNVLTTTVSNLFGTQDIGSTVVGICNPVSNVQTIYEGTLGTQIDTTHWNVSTNPSSICTVPSAGSTANMEIGPDITSQLNTALVAQSSGNTSKIVIQLGAGVFLTHKQTAAPQTIVGLSPTQSQLAGYPCEDVLEVQGGFNTDLENFYPRQDWRCDLRKGYQYIDSSGNLNVVAAPYRPIGQQTIYANNALGSGWIQGLLANNAGAINGVAATIHSSAALCVPTAEANKLSNTEQLVFPYFSTIFSTTVSSVGGTCPGSAPGTLVTMVDAFPSGTQYDTVQSEWFAGTSFQNIQTAIPATGRTFPFTLTVANPLVPSLSSSSNVGGTGAFKGGAEHFLYDKITRSLSGTNSFHVTSSVENGTGATGPLHSIGEIIVPVNPLTFDAMPWPVIPTLNTSTITSCSITSNIATCLGPNSFYTGLVVTIEGFSGSSGTQFLNTQQSGLKYTILSSGLSGTQFEFNFPHADVTGTSGGVALTQTPQNAEFFPSHGQGNYGIGNDVPDGSLLPKTGCFDCTFKNMQMGQWPLSNQTDSNGDSDFYWVGVPYESHFDGIDMAGNSCYVEGTPGINTYDNPSSDGDGTTWNRMSCRAFTGGDEFILRNHNHSSADDLDLYGGGNEVSGALAATGFNITGYSCDTTNCYGGVSEFTAKNIHNEPGNAVTGGTGSMELNCNTCSYTAMHDSGGGDFIVDGAKQKFHQGTFNNSGPHPFIIYGANTTFDETSLVTGTLGGTFNATNSILPYAPQIHGCAENSTQSHCVQPTWGMIDQSKGQTADSFATGNLANPYVNAVGGLLTADSFSSMDVKWTPDPTLLAAGGQTTGYEGCNLQKTLGHVCYIINSGTISPGSVLAPEAYSLTMLVKQQAGSAQSFTLQTAINSAGSCVGGVFTNTPVPVSTTWAVQAVQSIDLSAYSGCNFQIILVSQNTGSNEEIDVAFTDLQPIAHNILSDSFSTTGNGICDPTKACIFSASGVPTGCGTTYHNGSVYLNKTGAFGTAFGNGSLLWSCDAATSTWKDIL